MQYARRFVPAALLLIAAPLAAQKRDLFTPYDGPRRLEISATAGYFWSSDWSNLVLFESLGVTGPEARRVLLPELRAAPGRGATAAITYWKGRLGFRAEGSYNESCLTAEPRCGPSRGDPTAGGPPSTNPTQVSLKTYSYGVEGIVGMMEYSRKQWFRPYFMVGAGGVTFDPSESIPLFLAASGAQLGTVTLLGGGLDEFAFSVDRAGLETRFAVSMGAGTDLRLPVGPGGLSLRFEVADHMSQSPLGVRLTRLSSGTLSRDNSFQQVDLGVSAVHNVRATIGLALEFGVKHPPQQEPDDGFLPFPIPTPPGAKGGRGSN